MMKGLLVQNWSGRTIFALLIGILGLIAVAEASSSLMSEQALVVKMANVVALGIDSLASVEEGKIEMPTEIDTRYYIRISFEDAGKKEGYEIFKEGWYAIVTLKRDKSEASGVSRIYSYPPKRASGLGAEIARPRSLCIVKEAGKEYPEVVDRVVC